MKRVIALIMLLALALSVFAACEASEQQIDISSTVTASDVVDESVTESFPESYEVSDIVSIESSEVIEIDYDKVLYSTSVSEISIAQMDEPTCFRENGRPGDGPCLEEYLEDNTVSDDTYIFIKLRNYDKSIDDLLAYLEGRGYIEHRKTSETYITIGFITYKGLKQLYEDNYAMEYEWLRKDALSD